MGKKARHTPAAYAASARVSSANKVLVHFKVALDQLPHAIIISFYQSILFHPQSPFFNNGETVRHKTPSGGGRYCPVVLPSFNNNIYMFIPIKGSSPSRTPTCNLRFRRALLCAIELWDHIYKYTKVEQTGVEPV